MLPTIATAINEEKPKPIMLSDCASSRMMVEGYPNGALLLKMLTDNGKLAKEMLREDVCFKFTAYNNQQLPDIKAAARQARVSDLRPYLLHTLYAGHAQSELSKLSADTPIPGYIVVLPEQQLSGEHGLVVQDPQQQLQISWPILPEFEPELRAELRAAICQYEGKPTAVLGLLFNAPIAREKAAEIFRSLQIRCNNTAATPAEGQTVQTLKLGGQDIRFKLIEETDHPLVPENANTGAILHFPQPYTDRLLIAVEGELPLPSSLHLTVPAGTQAMHGLSCAKAAELSVELTGALPALGNSFTKPFQDAFLVPAKGEHQLQLPCAGVGEVTVRVAKLEPQKVLQVRQCIKYYGYDEYFTKSLLLSKLLDCGKDCFLPEQVCTPHPTPFGRGYCDIDLDSLCGGTCAPGYYLLHARTQLPQKQYQSDMKVMEHEFCYLVHVTDLHLCTLGNKLLATHLSDGSAVQQAELFYCSEQTLEKKGELLNGILTADSTHQTANVLQCGEDYAFLPDSLSLTPQVKPHTGHTLQLLTDRNIYRKGETIYVFGTLRQLDDEQWICLPEAQQITLNLNDADGELICSRVLSTNEYGAFHAELELPLHHFYNTDSMSLTAKTADGTQGSLNLRCTAFERDSFEVNARADMLPIHPKHVTFYIQAKDFNGMPVSGAEATVTFFPEENSDDEDSEISSDIYVDDDDEEEADIDIDIGLHDEPEKTEIKKQSPVRFKVALNADGKAEFRAEWAQVLPDKPESTLMVPVQISVTNDRQECVSAPLLQLSLHPAALDVHFDGRRIRCTQAGTQTPLATDQMVHVQVCVPKYEYHMLPNGIGIPKRVQSTVAEHDICVPAGTIHGVDFLPETENATLVLSATDADGNTVCQSFNTEDVNETSKHTITVHSIQPGDGQKNCPELLLPKFMRHCQPVLVRAEHAAGTMQAEWDAENARLRIPLKTQDYGQCADVTLLFMQADEDGLYRRGNLYTARLELPHRENQLEIILDTPQQELAPRSTVSLSGRVVQADGSPAANALVCLYAVDKGIQSLTHYSFSFTLAALQTPQISSSPLLTATVNTYRDMHKLPLRLCLPQNNLNNILHTLHCRTNVFLTRYSGLHERIYSTLYGPAYLWPRIPIFPRPWEDDIFEDEEFFDDDDYVDGTLGDGTLGDGLGAPWLLEEECELEPSDAVCMCIAHDEEEEDNQQLTLRIRADFTPTAVWNPTLMTDADGRFSLEFTVPDTLTSYHVYAVALSADGHASGKTQSEFTVNQPLMVTPGTPFFMSVGDQLALPVTISNNSDQQGTWQLSLSGTEQTQEHSTCLQAGESKTIFFTVQATKPGSMTLRWQAIGSKHSDAVDITLPVRYPVPELSERQFRDLRVGDAELKPADCLSPQLSRAPELNVLTEISANPLTQLRHTLDFALEYPYGCTEQRSSTLMPWLLHQHLAGLSDTFAKVSEQEVREAISKTIAVLESRICKDGGLGYWDAHDDSCLWASAHAALVLTLAEENGYAVPQHLMESLRTYFKNVQTDDEEILSPYAEYSIGRLLGDEAMADAAIKKVLRNTAWDSEDEEDDFECDYSWMNSDTIDNCFLLLHTLRSGKSNHHAAIQKWLSAVSKLRHLSTWETGWIFITLHEIIRTTPQSEQSATVVTNDGSVLTVGTESICCKAQSLRCSQGHVYVTIKATAVPDTSTFSAAPHPQLRLERHYEKKNEQGEWVPTQDWRVGDEVKVTLTCSTEMEDISHLVVEDYLPAGFKAIRDSAEAKEHFNHYEYLGDRVRAFADDVYTDEASDISFSYRARVIYSGNCTAAPASAGLMYQPDINTYTEPQTFSIQP